MAYRALGDTVQARALVGALVAAVARDGRPQLRDLIANETPRTARDPTTLTGAATELRAVRRLVEALA